MSGSVVGSDVVVDKVLPVAVSRFFRDEKGLSAVEIQGLANLYEGPKVKPSFQEWLEVYQQFCLLKQCKHIERGLDSLVSHRRVLDADLVVAIDSGDFKEVKRLQNALSVNSQITDRRERLLLDTNRELNKVLQNQLSREAPKQVQVQSLKVTPKDVAAFMKRSQGDLV